MISGIRKLTSAQALLAPLPTSQGTSPARTSSRPVRSLLSRSTTRSVSVFYDAFTSLSNATKVMKAWGESLDGASSSGIRFLGDPAGEFTKELDLFFDSAAVFGQNRSKRYAIVTEDGKVKSIHEEPDNTGVNESAAEKVLA